MLFRLILFVWAFVLDPAAVSRLAEDEKDVEIMLLRQQLRIVERKQPRGPLWGLLSVSGCIFPSSSPSVVMVQPTENRNSNDALISL
jgi:hypothetical protein